jgi:hypothetical protein
MGQKSSHMRKKSLSDSGSGSQESGRWGFTHPPGGSPVRKKVEAHAVTVPVAYVRTTILVADTPGTLGQKHSFSTVGKSCSSLVRLNLFGTENTRQPSTFSSN